MTSIVTTIKTDIGKAVAWVEAEFQGVSQEALVILRTLAVSGGSQLLTLLKESSVGTDIEDAITAVKGDSGDLLAALPTIIGDATKAVAAIKAPDGSVIEGLESFAENIATSLVTMMVADAKNIPNVAALITAVSALL